jgi:light-regulated signal transduction histidine kinase (bacteriophytochrome)
MAQLIDDMLRLSRITRADMTLGNVNLSEIAQSISTKIKSNFPKRKIKFIITPGLTVKADKNLLSIVLENLFENAAKFTGKMPQARIEFGIAEKDGQAAYFVRDNGVGFDMTYANKLFKPFQRLHTVAEFPGTGVGLASVQRIIQRHGGQVWAEGKVGEGATFYFTLEENKVI